VPECREDAEPDEERRGGGERGLSSCARVAMIASYSDCKVATVCSDRFLKTASSSIFSAIDGFRFAFFPFVPTFV
jgi:hypothetical protein